MWGILNVALAMSSPTAVVVGLNGALQKRFILPDEASLVPGNVHRAASVQTGVGGKGQDVAITLRCLSSESTMNLVQFVGKDSAGNSVHDLLLETLGKDSMGLTVRVESDMRTCTSIVAKDETTELVEPSGTILKDEMKELMKKLESEVQNHSAGLCIMGSMPPGCPDDTYAEIYSRCAGPSTLCLVDSVAGVEPLLQSMASMENSGSVVFKVNAAELCNLAGIKKGASETAGVSTEELTSAISSFIDKFSPHALTALDGIAITDGRHPGYFAAFGEKEKNCSIFRIPIPVLKSSQTLFPIGAGDAVAAGTLAAWLFLSNEEKHHHFLTPQCCQLLKDRLDRIKLNQVSPQASTLVSAFAFGTACGSASCLQEENSVIDVTDIPKLLETVGEPEFLSTLKF